MAQKWFNINIDKSIDNLQNGSFNKSEMFTNLNYCTHEPITSAGTPGAKSNQ